MDQVIPASLPVLPLSRIIVFPHMITPLSIGKQSSIEAVREAYKNGRLILLLNQKQPVALADEVGVNNLYEMGCCCCHYAI